MHTVLRNEHLGDKDDDTVTSQDSCHKVTRFFTRHTQLISLLTVQHDYLLFIKWGHHKGLHQNCFLRGEIAEVGLAVSGMAVAEEVAEVKGEMERQAHSV